MRGINRRGIAIVLGLVAVVSACGGSSYKGLSKADYVSQANAICKKYSGLADAAGNTLGSNPTEQQVVDAVKSKLVPLFSQELAEIRKLKPPKEDRATVKTMLDEQQAAINDVSQNTKQFVEAQGSTALSKKADASATAYGLTDCVNNSSG